MSDDFLRRLPHSGQLAGGAQQLFNFLHLDWQLMLILGPMLVAGGVVLYSADDSGSFLQRQMIFMGIGTVIMLVIAQIRPMVMRRWAWLIYALGLALLIGVLVGGSGAKGAQRWIDLGFFRFQPSEVVKLALPLALAGYLGDRAMPLRPRYILVAALLVAVPVTLILIQPDLGTGILVAAAGAVVLFLSGLRWRHILGALMTLPFLMWLAWQLLLHDYQKQRVLTLFNPEADKLGSGWNIIQSTTAIGSGGWSGKGWMSGTQSQLDFLPESHTDFIIAVLAEEFGFQGVLLLLTGYLLLFVRGFWISYTAKTNFSRMVAGSITFTIFLYVFVNMGMVSGILPVVGVPLPLFSYGGTSLISMFIAIGILMVIAKEEDTLHAK